MVDFAELARRTPEQRKEMRDSLDREIKAREQRTEMMIRKLVDQVAGGFIDNDWAEEFIMSVQAKFNAGLPLTDKQQAKLEELFERY